MLGPVFTLATILAAQASNLGDVKGESLRRRTSAETACAFLTPNPGLYLTCGDGSTCPSHDSDCCKTQSRGGRARCWAGRTMCADLDNYWSTSLYRSGYDYSCATNCDTNGGPRRCTGNCVGWRQTTGCTSTSSRDPDNDKDCATMIPPTDSGFCECSDGTTRPLDCDTEDDWLSRRDWETCAEACRVPLYTPTYNMINMIGGTDPDSNGWYKPVFDSGSILNWVNGIYTLYENGDWWRINKEADLHYRYGECGPLDNPESLSEACCNQGATELSNGGVACPHFDSIVNSTELLNTGGPTSAPTEALHQTSEECLNLFEAGHPLAISSTCRGNWPSDEVSMTYYLHLENIELKKKLEDLEGEVAEMKRILNKLN